MAAVKRLELLGVGEEELIKKFEAVGKDSVPQKKINLTERQWEMMQCLRAHFTQLPLVGINKHTYMSLIRLGMLEFNDKRDAVKLTELGKTI